MKKEKRLLIILIILFLIAISIFLLIKFPFPCDYESGWKGVEKRTCDCIGTKIDTTPKDITDAGTSMGCIGIPINGKCYIGEREDNGLHWIEEDCNKNS